MGLWQEPEIFWEERRSCTFPKELEVVRVKGFTGTNLAADFLKFILSVKTILEEARSDL
uniref:Uncharacterized protein n=1 Tax=Arundo donax TaxID=35708 RepID=A0A0A9BFH8_ARUDO